MIAIKLLIFPLHLAWTELIIYLIIDLAILRQLSRLFKYGRGNLARIELQATIECLCLHLWRLEHFVPAVSLNLIGPPLVGVMAQLAHLAVGHEQRLYIVVIKLIELVVLLPGLYCAICVLGRVGCRLLID